MSAYRCLDLAFSARSPDPTLDRRIAALLAACATHEAPSLELSILPHRDGSAPFTVCADGRRLATVHDAADAVARLVWEVNRRAIEGCTSAVVLHAGAVARDGSAIVLAGPSGSGKSTLVAALVTRGFAYLTDEAVAIEGERLLARPYPKPIAVPAASRASLHGARPDLRLGLDTEPGVTERAGSPGSPEVLIPVGALGGAVAAPSRPAVVVTPRYTSESPARLVPASRADTLVALMQQIFGLPERGPRAFDVLARVLGGAECYRLEFGDPIEAAALIAASVPGAGGAGPPSPDRSST